jgi:carbonic anhydrase
MTVTSRLTGRIALLGALTVAGARTPAQEAKPAHEWDYGRELGPGHYTFEGSLTTPPCSESVTWYVLKHPVSVSTEEVTRFSKLYRDNARPVQPLNDRVVKVTR